VAHNRAPRPPAPQRAVPRTSNCPAGRSCSRGVGRNWNGDPCFPFFSMQAAVNRLTFCANAMNEITSGAFS
jgi:hypothetical protein